MSALNITVIILMAICVLIYNIDKRHPEESGKFWAFVIFGSGLCFVIYVVWNIGAATVRAIF